jgi:hypothetical protein
MRKRVVLIVVFVSALVSSWPIYSRIRQAHRDVVYRAAIAPFQRDLHVGMSEPEVRQYLDSRHVEYNQVRFGGSDGPTYEIKIGEQDSLICEWEVFVALEFGPTDALKEVHLRRIGTCP